MPLGIIETSTAGTESVLKNDFRANEKNASVSDFLKPGGHNGNYRENGIGYDAKT